MWENLTIGLMCMNFIFDIGNVLIDFKPIPFLQKLFSEPTLEAKMYETIFKSAEWIDMDRGIVTHKDASDIFCLREPDYRAEITLTMQRLNEMLTPISDTIDLLPKLKAHGHNLYYLSNYHNELRNYVMEKYPFFSLFDGGVFSCDVQIIKPEIEIYRRLLCMYKLSPKDCVFFDDIAENVEVAMSEGINGILFTDAECVKSFL